MNLFKLLNTLACSVALTLGLAACSTAKPQANVKPYALDTCVVCGMKCDGMGKPYSFVYEGREIKVCDKDEEVEFRKNPAKYLKVIEAAETAKK